MKREVVKGFSTSSFDAREVFRGTPGSRCGLLVARVSPSSSNARPTIQIRCRSKRQVQIYVCEKEAISSIRSETFHFGLSVLFWFFG